MGSKSLVYSMGFTENDLESKILSFPRDAYLSGKIGEVLYFGEEKSEQMKTRFYWIQTSDVTHEEVRTIHERIWNENKSDLLFIETEEKIEVKYVNTSPKDDLVVIDSFSITTEVDELLEKISKERITTGAFWMGYYEALERITKQHQTVDQGLVESLSGLRVDLDKIYLNRIPDAKPRGRVVQALIDRTLFIKFLEDKKIINSRFYQKYFGDEDIEYKVLLEQKNARAINNLFSRINEIFNNKLFVTPKIEAMDLLDAALEAIEHSIAGTRDGQLCLFDFQFDIIPVEFISHIYQIFLDDKKAEHGIFYTPKGLADVLIHSVINDSGKVLDPSCGSGIFLVLAFRKMYKAPADMTGTYERIQHRSLFIKENIFGIEIENTAARLAFFSLYLEVLNGITSEKLNNLVTNIMDEDDDRRLFSIDFSDNIQEKNALVEGEGAPFEGERFDYIIGNPPWFVISQDTKEDNDAINYRYWDKHRQLLTRERQISQCFLVRVKGWSDRDTRFGFIVNSSNFLNTTKSFQDFFFSNYRVERFFELSHLKKILFDFADEPACLIVFDNGAREGNVFDYFLPRMNRFTETFKTVIIDKNEVIKIKQKDVLEHKVSLRDFLIGTDSELSLANKLKEKHTSLSALMLKGKNYSIRGFEIWGKDALEREFGKIRGDVSDEEYKLYQKKLIDRYFSDTRDEEHTIPFVKSAQLDNFRIKKVNAYLKEDIQNFHRPRDPFIYEGDKILCARISGELKALYTKEKIYFASDIYVIKLNDPKLYPAITCCLNSDLLNYYSQVKQRKRIDSSMSRLDSDNIKEVPMPRRFDREVVEQLNVLSENITKGKYTYEEKRERLNELVFDLYEVNFIERQRITDFFIPDDKRLGKDVLEEYCQTFLMAFKRVVKTGIVKMEYSYNLNMPFDMACVRVIFGENNPGKPLIEEARFDTSHELVKQAGKSLLISTKERVYSEDSMLIVKDTHPKNWTKSAAYDDAKVEILKVLHV